MTKIKSYDRNGQEYEFEESEYIYRKSVYGLYIKDDSVLMIMDDRSGKWELPGGGVEEGESDLQNLQREMLEETGLEMPDQEINLLDSEISYYYALLKKSPMKTDRFYYLVKELREDDKILENGNNDDVAAAKYVPISDLENTNIAKKDLEVINNYLSSNKN